MSKVQFYFDKKQLPQVIGLGLLSAGMFGYFSVKILTPPPPEAAAAATVNTATVKDIPVMSPAEIEVASLTNGTAPSPVMHDPFTPLPTPSSPPVPALNPLPKPAAFDDTLGHLNPLQPMPSDGEIRPLSGLSPAPFAAPPVIPTTKWVVTGVIVGPGSRPELAVLRDGDARRIVALGSMVDDQFRLVGISREGATLRAEGHNIQLKLGGDEPADNGISTGSSSTGLGLPNISLSSSAESPASTAGSPQTMETGGTGQDNLSNSVVVPSTAAN